MPSFILIDHAVAQQQKNFGKKVKVSVEYCVSYKEWTEAHPQLARHLQECADQGKYYQVYPTEEIIVDSSIYKGTICALSGAPLGTCKGVVPEGSSTCESCKALICGKTSTLN